MCHRKWGRCRSPCWKPCVWSFVPCSYLENMIIIKFPYFKLSTVFWGIFRIGVLIQIYVNDSAHAFQVCWCKLPCHKISSSLSLTKNKLGMKLLFNCYITTIMSSMRCLVIHVFMTQSLRNIFCLFFALFLKAIFLTLHLPMKLAFKQDVSFISLFCMIIWFIKLPFYSS